MSALDDLIATLPDASQSGPWQLGQGVDPKLIAQITAYAKAGQTDRLPALIAERDAQANFKPAQTPDGAVKATLAARGNDVDSAIAALPQAQDVGPGQAALIAGGGAFDSLAAGLRSATPAPVRNALDWVNNKLGMGAPPSIDPAVRAGNAAALAPLNAAHPVATTIGETIPYLATANPLAMAGMAALDYGTPGERAERAAFAFGGGKLGQGVARMLGPASMATAPGNAAADFFADAPNKFGIPLTTGQATGYKPAQIAESVLSNLPFGGAVNQARNATFGAFNRAVSNTFGQDSAQLTPQLLGQALDSSGQKIGDVMSRAKVTLDQPLALDIAQVSSRIGDLGDSEGNILNRKIVSLLDRTSDGETLTGSSLRMFDSSLGRIIGNTDNGDLRFAVGQLQDALRNAAGRTLSQADQDALKLARQQNFNVRQVADAIKANPEGNALSPSRLMQVVNAAQKGAKFGGGNNLAELAQWGAANLPDKIPNSGTAQRMFIQNMITNPISSGAALLGGGYALDKGGVDMPGAAYAAPLVPLLLARGLAGKPASDLTRSLLTRGGGLLGLAAGNGQ